MKVFKSFLFAFATVALAGTSALASSQPCLHLLTDKYQYVPFESDYVIHTEQSIRGAVEVSRTAQSFKIIQSGLVHDGLTAYKVLNEWQLPDLSMGSVHQLMAREGGYILMATRVSGTRNYRRWEPIMAAPIDGIVFTDYNGQKFKWTKLESFEVPAQGDQPAVTVHDVFQKNLISPGTLGADGHSFTVFAKGLGPVYAEMVVPQYATVSRTWYQPRH